MSSSTCRRWADASAVRSEVGTPPPNADSPGQRDSCPGTRRDRCPGRRDGPGVIDGAHPAGTARPGRDHWTQPGRGHRRRPGHPGAEVHRGPGKEAVRLVTQRPAGVAAAEVPGGAVSGASAVITALRDDDAVAAVLSDAVTRGRRDPAADEGGPDVGHAGAPVVHAVCRPHHGCRGCVRQVREAGVCSSTARQPFTTHGPRAALAGRRSRHDTGATARHAGRAAAIRNQG